jgi:hypothetical protein
VTNSYLSVILYTGSKRFSALPSAILPKETKTRLDVSHVQSRSTLPISTVTAAIPNAFSTYPFVVIRLSNLGANGHLRPKVESVSSFSHSENDYA